MQPWEEETDTKQQFAPFAQSDFKEGDLVKNLKSAPLLLSPRDTRRAIGSEHVKKSHL